jgi:hypothetical protein
MRETVRIIDAVNIALLVYLQRFCYGSLLCVIVSSGRVSFLFRLFQFQGCLFANHSHPGFRIEAAL